LSNLSVFVVKRRESCAFMKRKTPISTTERFNPPDNPAWGRYRTDWLAEANATFSSEAQFHGFLEESPDAKIIIDQTGRINFATKRIEAMFGHLPDELIGKPISVLIPERYRDLHVGHLDRFMNNPTPRLMGAGLELRALRKDGSELQVEISLSPHPTPDGPVVVAAIRDVEVAKRFQSLLLEELHHRVKNMLTTVIAITSQSLQSAQNLEEGRLAVEARLTALGRVHDLLLETKRAGAKLTDVIRSAIEPFDSHNVRRFVVQATHIEIASEAVLPLTMCLNELCANAVKYGALSNATGRIDITSTADDKALRLKLTWTERGGPVVREPTRRSFGTRLIKGLAGQLHGDVRLRYEPEGVVFELDIPLSATRAARAN
jgi:PAS domain S-box-containing protein